ncbi:MAG: hypothetical protein DMG38_04625 [Acidobacteria bacterium]|nr:MAG: hypothetical protein DMG38_04625 [Acidobacteriota bacterium]
MLQRIVPIAVLILLVGSGARADSLSDIRRACLERGNFHKGIHWLEECVQEMFTAEPFHVTLSSVAPGAGLAAFGPALGQDIRIAHLDFLFASSLAASTDGSYVGAAQVTFALPTRSFFELNEDSSRSARQKYGFRSLERLEGVDPLYSKMSVTMGYRRFDAREQDFYGLGPGATLSGHAGYGLLYSDTYVKIDNPVSSWNTVGFNFSFLQPRVTSTINTAIPQIRAAYNETTAPGLTSRDDFLRYEPYVLFRIPAHRSFFTTLRVGYGFYQALGDRGRSFQRLSGTDTVFIPLWVPSKGTPKHRNAFLNQVCPSLRSAKDCSLGDLRFISSVVASYKGAVSEVPFYFDQTLGGTDIGGDDTLRGFADYRFRAPSSLLFQVEYRHNLWGPFGLLSFYDMGKVALLPSDISLNHFRHDIGVGLYARAGNRELMRIYVGFGTGEGARMHPRVPVSF